MIKSFIKIDRNNVQLVGDNKWIAKYFEELVSAIYGDPFEGTTFQHYQPVVAGDLLSLWRTPVFIEFNGEWFVGNEPFFELMNNLDFLRGFPRETLEFILENSANKEKAREAAIGINVDFWYQFSTNFVVKMYEIEKTLKVGSYHFEQILLNRKDVPDEVLKEIIRLKNFFREPISESDWVNRDFKTRMVLALWTPVSLETLEELLVEVNNGSEIPLGARCDLEYRIKKFGNK